MEFHINDRVIPNWGRNKGRVGTIESINGEWATVVWGTIGISDNLFRSPDREVKDFYYVNLEDLTKA